MPYREILKRKFLFVLTSKTNITEKVRPDYLCCWNDVNLFGKKNYKVNIVIFYSFRQKLLSQYLIGYLTSFIPSPITDWNLKISLPFLRLFNHNSLSFFLSFFFSSLPVFYLSLPHLSFSSFTSLLFPISLFLHTFLLSIILMLFPFHLFVLHFSSISFFNPLLSFPFFLTHFAYQLSLYLLFSFHFSCFFLPLHFTFLPFSLNPYFSIFLLLFFSRLFPFVFSPFPLSFPTFSFLPRYWMTFYIAYRLNKFIQTNQNFTRNISS